MGIKLNIKDIDPEGIDPQEKIEMQEAADYFKASAAAHKQNAKEMRKVFLTVGIIVLALAVIFFAIMAWFANNKEVTGRGMTVASEPIITTINDYYVYYTAKDSSGTTLYKRRKLTSSTTTKMPDFDAQFDDNENTAIYFRTYYQSTSKFDPTTHNLIFTVGRDSNATWKTRSGEEPYYMSSILEVNCGPVPALQSDKSGATADLYGGSTDAEIENVYKAAKANFENVTGTTFFVNKSSPSTATYKEEISFTIEGNYKVYKFKTTVDGESVYMYRTYIYVELDYCPSLIKKFYKFNSEGYGDVGTTGYKRTFTKDTATLSVMAIEK